MSEKLPTPDQPNNKPFFVVLGLLLVTLFAILYALALTLDVL